ncbi:MAG TPA: DUF1800 domain-containing protein [Acidisarcina sp.]
MRKVFASIVAVFFLATTASPSWPQVAQGTKQPALRHSGLPGRSKTQNPNIPLTDQERASQMLNRFTFGPRPGDLAAVMQVGSEAWFEQQLTPDAIPDATLTKRLADFPALNLPVAQLIADYPTNQILRAVTEGKRPMPQDPTLAAVYQVLVEKYIRQQQEQKAAGAAAALAVAHLPAQRPSDVKLDAGMGMDPTSKMRDVGQPLQGQTPTSPPAQEQTSTMQTGAMQTEVMQTGAGMAMTPDQIAAQADAKKAAQKKLDQAAAQLLADQLLGLPKNQRMAAILKLPVDQRIVLTTNVADPQKGLLNADFNPREREIFGEMGGGPDAAYVLDNELQQAKIVRAIVSERQLQEVMTDFWFNHFNIFIHKDSDQFYAAGYERDAIRPHALGKFRDLLLATAQHPAMLVYLDNWLSIGPDSMAAGKPKPSAKPPAKPQAQRGLNENYGREVMELHTVGVNGGYTQSDVTNLAKILTGWTVDHPELGGPFLFDPKKHEPGPKKWFGQTVPENGYNEGRDALVWLAAQPQTAHFISYKLAQRFVADRPPTALVDRMAATFLSSDGDIKEVLRTMVHSPEFNSRKYYRDKVKTPLEFVASAFRATGTNPTNAGALVGVLRNMGEPLYQMLPPTGYAMTADAWMNSGALVDRLNFSLQLANSKIGNIKFDAPHLLAAGLLARPAIQSEGRAPLHTASMLQAGNAGAPSGAEEALRLMETVLIDGQVSAKTNGVIQGQIVSDLGAKPPVDASQTLDTMTALILGSPEFQMR